MFWKCVKYELRNTFRVFLPIWGAILVLAVVNGFTLDMSEAPDGLGGFMSVAMPAFIMGVGAFAAVIFAFIYVLQRFYKGLLGDAGYLMFTLPVRTASLVGSKLLSAVVMETVSGLVALLSGIIVLSMTGAMNFTGFLRNVGEHFGEFFTTGAWLTALLAGILMLVSAAAFNLRFYLAMALGHLSRSHRVLVSIAAYVGIGIALSILTVTLMPSIITIDLAGETINAVLSTANGITVGSILPELAVAAAFFFGTVVILEKKLNLE